MDNKQKSFLHKNKLKFFSNKISNYLSIGNYKSLFKSSGIEFSDVRQYVDGDDIRNVDWNLTSRTNTLHTKTFKEDREINMYILVDVSRSTLGEKKDSLVYENLLNVFTLFILTAFKSKDKVGIIFFSDRIEKYIKPSNDRKHCYNIIEDFLNIEPEGKGSDIYAALKFLSGKAKKKSICILLSDFMATGYGGNFISALSRKHSLVFIKFNTMFSKHFPFNGFLKIRDLETDSLVDSYGGSNSFMKSYDDYWKGKDLYYKVNTKNGKVISLELEMEDNVIFKVLDFFKRNFKKFNI